MPTEVRAGQPVAVRLELQGADGAPIGDRSVTAELAAVIGQATAMVTIRDNDAYRITVGNSPLLVEGDSGTRDMVFPVQVAPVPTVPLTVEYRADGGTATLGDDYARASGVLTFAPGSTLGEVRVPIRGDRLREADETVALVVLEVGGSGSVDFGRGGIGTIRDDDTVVAPRIEGIAVQEGRVVVTVGTLPGLRHQLESRVALGTGSWEPVASAKAGDGAVLPFEVLTPLEGEIRSGFFRVVVIP